MFCWFPTKPCVFYTTDEKGEVKRYKDKGVWILKDKKPVRINVTTGVSDDDKTEISSREIKAGDEVILEDKNAELAKEQMRMRMPR